MPVFNLTRHIGYRSFPVILSKRSTGLSAATILLSNQLHGFLVHLFTV
jgi:hypothetical protein